jgi:hypothetical protein
MVSQIIITMSFYSILLCTDTTGIGTRFYILLLNPLSRMFGDGMFLALILSLGIVVLESVQDKLDVIYENWIVGQVFFLTANLK